MKIRPLYFSDEIFYWARSGRQATVIELHCTLAQKVDPEVLERALLNALQVHQNFRIRPVIVRGRFQVMDEEVKRAPLYARDGRKRQLGTADTLEKPPADVKNGLLPCIHEDSISLYLINSALVSTEMTVAQ